MKGSYICTPAKHVIIEFILFTLVTAGDAYVRL